DATYGITTTQYAGLGRVVQVIPQDGTTPPGAPPTQCQANNICTDYSDFPTVTATDPAGNRRRSHTNALGLLVEVDEPGPGSDFPGTSGHGSISISGALQSTTTSANATASVTVSGAIESLLIRVCDTRCHLVRTSDPGGHVSITVNGHTNSVVYNGTATASFIASNLVDQINNDTGAFASASGPSC